MARRYTKLSQFPEEMREKAVTKVRRRFASSAVTR